MKGEGLSEAQLKDLKEWLKSCEKYWAKQQDYHSHEGNTGLAVLCSAVREAYIQVLLKLVYLEDDEKA